MPKREGGTAGARLGIPIDQSGGLAEAETLRERALGETGGPQPAPGLASTLRPQQGRNVVWRWQLRRRRAR